jgi:HTH-type transcriptional regulator/antitoxin HigA
MFEGAFDDASILHFAKEIDIHPAIIRGRVCFENNEYYKKRNAINSLNVLDQ